MPMWKLGVIRVLLRSVSRKRKTFWCVMEHRENLGYLPNYDRQFDNRGPETFGLKAGVEQGLASKS